MSGRSEVERFIRDVLNNEPLREEVRSLGTDQDAVIRHANAKGYGFSLADLHACAMNEELSDTQLEGVSGGLDAAFLRRIAVVVNFPTPDPEEREKLWRGLFPRT